MSNPNLIKTSHNFPVEDKEFIVALARANNTNETQVLRYALNLLKTLGSLGVRNEVNLIPQVVETSEDYKSQLESTTVALPLDLIDYTPEVAVANR